MNTHLATAALLDATVGHAASVLIASFWEGILLAAVAGICLRLVPRSTARFRFSIWTAAFVALVVLPFLNARAAGHSAASAVSSGAPHLQLDSRWSYALAILWLAAVLIRGVHLLVQAFNLRSLWKSAIPITCNIPGISNLGPESEKASQSGTGFFRSFNRSNSRPVELCTSTDLDRPSVIGFFSPRILIPTWLFHELSPGELHQIVLHELEHLRRRDDWLNLLQKIGLVLFPLNPALVWIDRCLATERELACDDGVLSRTHAPRAYATCLTTLAERRLEHRRHSRLTVLALGIMGAIRRSDLSRRIESILAFGFGGRASSGPAYAHTSALLVLAGVLGSTFVLARAPQLVSFEDVDHTAKLTHADSTSTVPAMHVSERELSPVRFENAVFHPAQAAAGSSPAPRPIRKAKVKPHCATPAVDTDPVNPVDPQSLTNPLLVLTSSRQQSAPQPVLLTLPDGRTFLATYTASPAQSGWLFIQL